MHLLVIPILLLVVLVVAILLEILESILNVGVVGVHTVQGTKQLQRETDTERKEKQKQWSERISALAASIFETFSSI